LSDNPAEVGDEAVLHARRGVHVVVVGADRVAAAREAAARGAEVVLCDDGLQHYRLARDYEIAVVDATRALGNGWLLPAGPLREPAARLETVDAVVATSRRADASASNEPLCSRRPPRLAAQLRLGTAVNLVDGERRALASFTTATDLHAVAAVGHPQAFFAALRAAGLQVLTHALPDHAALDPAALPFPPQATVLMTEKDAVKCRGFAQPGWWWVELEVEVDAAATDELLESLFERIRRARPGVSLG
jgi:tetraacyldisaccharide 4'-kinase